MILEEVLKRDDHFDADEFTSDLRQKGLKVSRATVYRTLDILNDIGIVYKSSFGHRHQHFEKMVGREHHDHMICLKCDKVIEFVDEEIEKRQDEICASHNFKPVRHNLQIFGYFENMCELCTKKD